MVCGGKKTNEAIALFIKIKIWVDEGKTLSAHVFAKLKYTSYRIFQKLRRIYVKQVEYYI